MIDLMNLATARAQSEGSPALVAVTLKEVLHIHILSNLVESGLGRRLIFQGGTALRLCYGGVRYSEDLDFTTQDEIGETDMALFKKVFIDSVARSYGLEATVLPVKERGGRHVPVRKWAAKIAIPIPRAPKQVINIKVANIPSLSQDPLLVEDRYRLGFAPFYILTQSLEEIFADKLVAFVGREHLKARDLWDMHWLQQRGITPKAEHFLAKIDHYGITQWRERMQARLAQMNEPAFAAIFDAEMCRFLPNVHMQALDGGLRRLIFSVVEQRLGWLLANL